MHREQYSSIDYRKLQQWIDAIDSGEYQIGQIFHHKDRSVVEGEVFYNYSHFGVLCELYQNEARKSNGKTMILRERWYGIRAAWVEDGFGLVDRDTMYLNDRVSMWLGTTPAIMDDFYLYVTKGFVQGESMNNETYCDFFLRMLRKYFHYDELKALSSYAASRQEVE
jgi:hypothetical protein